MKRHLINVSAALLLSAFAGAAALSQTTADEKCDGPVYTRGGVTRGAVVTSKPEPGFTDEARKNNVSGRVKLSAVLCRTGRVTDIEVVEGLPHGQTELTVDAARRIKFTPAEKDGRAASQRVTLEYNFNIGGGGAALQGTCAESPALCAGRLVEEVHIEGNRRMTDEQIFNYIRTRSGNPYNPEQVQRDLQTLLDLPFFDKTVTRVTIADGARGGTVVIFTVMELPVIRVLTFEGLRSVSEAEVLKALRERRLGIWAEGIYDPVRATGAARAIRELLAERGRPGASVEVLVDQVSSQSVALTFFIVEGRAAPRPRPRQKLLRPPRQKLLQTPQVARASHTGVEIDWK